MSLSKMHINLNMFGTSIKYRIGRQVSGTADIIAPQYRCLRWRNGFALRQDVLLKSDSYLPSAALVLAFRLGFPALAALVAGSVRAYGSAKPTLLCQLYQLVQLCS